MTTRLSKSSFLRGLQCHKNLYLHRNHDELRDPPSPRQEFIFRTGHEVGALARMRFPGGALAVDRHPSRVQQSLARTKELIGQGETVLYEPAFIHDDVLVYVDILVQNGNGWEVYEVKSSGSVKDVNFADAAIQYYVLSGAGIQVDDISMVHLNTGYERQGELDLQQLFAIVSVLPQAEQLLPEIPDQLRNIRDAVDGGQVPDIDIGPHCSDPYDCDFMGHCWAHIPEVSVFDVARLQLDKRFGLYRSGVIRIEEIPSGFDLNAIANFHVRAHKGGTEVVDRPAIRRFLDGLQYPLYFLDFETFSPAIPPFDGTKPYGKIPFQYSLHRRESADDGVTHTGFLAEAETDPRQQLAASLLKEIGGEGDIVVYSQSFEKAVIEQLAQQLPDRADQLRALLPRIRDLMIPFQQRRYYHPDMNGKYSLKSVLPVLVPELSYEGLAISDGDTAMLEFIKLSEEMDQDQAKQIRDNLWKYCKLDTLAMVRILEELESLTEKPDERK